MNLFRYLKAQAGRFYRRYSGNLASLIAAILVIAIIATAVIAIVVGIWWVLCAVVVFGWNLIAPERYEIGMSHALGFWILVYVYMWISGKKRGATVTITRTRFR